MRAGRGPAVLASGGAGYAGSRVVLALLEAGCRAVVLDHLPGGRRAALPRWPPRRARRR